MTSAPTAPALRQRRVRERRSRGEVCLRITVHEHNIANALIASGRLSPAETERRGLVERELQAVLSEWCDRWRDA